MGTDARSDDDSLGISAAGHGESRDAEIARVQALLETRMLGAPLVSTKIGRFVVLERIGAGAMGVVYSAYDGQLDRRVALKVLRSRRDGDEHERRLVREAQAMARLSHPNVVTIHDVGDHADRLYLAMELVEGATLRRWLRADVRTWKEIVDVFAQAGRGLAAAHDAGLVHRDFKPDNLLVDRTGRVKVADFGLAHTGGTTDPSGSDASSSADASSDRLTRSGTIVGTPAYMSPEQASGEEPGPADDQFSYCVALYEALYGMRPFAGTRLTELLANIRSQTFAETPRGRMVPSHVRAIVKRGLAPERAQRWPSMTALVDALSTDPTRRRHRWVAAGGLVAACVGAVGVSAALRYRAVQRCEDAGADTRTLWNDDARERTRTAFASTDISFAPETWDRAAPILEAAVDGTASARIDACHARDIRAEYSESDARAVGECLDEQSTRIAALVEIWSAPDLRGVEHAVAASTQLPNASRCLDPRWLRDRPAPPASAEEREAVQAVRLQLAHSATLSLAGRGPEATEVVRAALGEADAIGYEPLRAEVLRHLGQLESDLGHPSLALAHQRAAFVAATRSRHDEEAGEAAVRSVFSATGAGQLDVADEWGVIADAVLDRSDRRETPIHAMLLGFRASAAVRRSRLEEADEMFAEADALLARIDPDPNSLIRAAVLENWGLADVARGAYDEAEDHHRAAYEIKLARLGAGHPDVGGSLNNLGIVEMQRGDFPSAAKLFADAIAVTELANGPHSPRLAPILDNLGLTETRMGHLDASLQLHTRALAIREAELGPDHIEVAATLSNLALVHLSENDFVGGGATLSRALTILEQNGLGDTAQAAALVDNLGLVAVALGDLELAVERHHRSLAMRERLLGPDHVDVAPSLSNLGEAELRSGRHEAAIEHAARAIAILEKSVGGDHFMVSYPLCVQAEARIEQGRLADAEPLAARALEIRTKNRMPPPDIAAASVLLARALRGRDDARADEHMAHAREACGPSQTPSFGECRRLAPYLSSE